VVFSLDGNARSRGYSMLSSERLALSIDNIRTDGGTQARAGANPAVVADYAEAMRNGAVFPPVVVFHDGTTYWLADGFHRVAAAKEAGKGELDAEVRQGGQRDALLFAAGANATHGLRRTNDDKRHAVAVLLADEEWGRWCDGEIARRCAVTDRFVAKVRRRLSPNGSEKERKVTRGGKTFTMNTARIGTRSTHLRPEGPTPASADAQDPPAAADEQFEAFLEGLESAPLDERLLEAQDTLNQAICSYNDAVKVVQDAYEYFRREWDEAREYLEEQGRDPDELEAVELDVPEELDEVSPVLPSFDDVE
jgi:ParB-like chromosome segregation protein Spo0J